MRKGRVLAAFVCGLALAAVTFAGVTGTAKFEGNPPPPGKGPFKAIDMAADPACAAKYASGEKPDSGKFVIDANKNLANVFVQVKNAPEGGAAPSEAVVIDQEGCLYHPRVVGVMVGQPLKFKNSDGILHNVHGLPKANREFNIGMPASLKEKDQTFNKPEPAFNVKCDVHPWMASYVAVMTHPYFAVSGSDGTFDLGKLPDGTYEVEAWHEMFGTQTGSVTVSGGNGTVDFTFSPPKR